MLSSDPGRTETIDFGGFGLGYLAAFVIYNVTEAGFRSLSFVFLTFLIIAIDYPQPRTVMSQS